MIPMFKVHTNLNTKNAVASVLDSGMLGEGPKTVEFKEVLEKRFGCNNLILLNSCTSALVLALRLAGVGRDDEVITTPFTMIATNVAIKSIGAKIVWADVQENNICASISDIKKKITSRTKAVVVTLVGGMPMEMEKLEWLGVPVIVDAAHGVDSYYKGKHISRWCHYACFSFQAIKQLNTGDGGAIVIREDEKYELGEGLKWFGMTRKIPEGKTRLQHQMEADVLDWGYKFHMNDIAASIGLTNITDLDVVACRHRNNAHFYMKELQNTPGVRMIDFPDDALSSWWVFGFLAERRDELIKFLANKGIESTPMWRRNDEYTCFADSKSLLPNLDKVINNIVFVPVGWWVADNDRQLIASVIKEFYVRGS